VSKIRGSILLLFVVTIVLRADAQETNRPIRAPVPGGILLLTGYTHQAFQGIDTRVGTISKTGGMTINYDIGSLAGNYATPIDDDEKKNLIWTKTQARNGLTVIISYSKGGNLTATFRESCANFFTSEANSDERIADFILMITTYNQKLPDIKTSPKKSRPRLQGC
jgi:hypothetical protein